MCDRCEVLAVSVAEAAALMNISRAKLYELIGRGEIPSIKLGGRRLVRVDALRALLMSLEAAQAAAVPASAGRTTTTADIEVRGRSGEVR